MTLPQALQELAPVPDDLPPDVRQRRETACEVVFRVLGALAPRVLRGSDHADDAVMAVLTRLLTTGPRGPGDQFAGDGQAEAYLRTALRNHQRDVFRRNGKLVFVDPDDPAGELMVTTAAAGRTARRIPPAPLAQLLDAERWHLLDEATTTLYEQALPAVAAHVHDPGRFSRIVLDVRDLARDATSIDAIVVRDGLTPGTTAINRLYQQHRRARGVFLERLRGWLADHPLPSDLDDVVRRLAEYDMASRVPRAGLPA